MRFWRRKNRCVNLSPSAHPAYRGRQCELTIGHEGMCRISVGAFKHYWRQEFHERLGQALRKENTR